MMCLFFLLLICGVYAYTDEQAVIPEPAVYLNFNEGSGNYAIDGSGHGSSGTLHNVSRVENGVCGRALMFGDFNSYADIPFTSQNHPTEEITVSGWFYTDSFEPQVLVSSYEEGGYRLGFDDGNDLWWTVNLENTGDVSIPVQHEGITPNHWHHITGTYDGRISRIYLDGVLRNQVNASGPIHYEYNNYVMLGADAGTGNHPGESCPEYFYGGLDEFRIYPTALTYGQVMDDRFRCSQEPVAPPLVIQDQKNPGTCEYTSGSLMLSDGDSTLRILTFTNKTENGIWYVTLSRGSKLILKAHDLYSTSYPDAWYMEIVNEQGRLARTIVFPNTNNAPIDAILPTGNATVIIRYFDGKEKFPAQVAVEFESRAPPPLQVIPQNILSNPIIVIYSASWATLIAIILVIVWLHKRKNTSQ
jgi:hypothetical protein